ncbi:Lrp/AsnC family transcriptional regulator [Amaricoccus sp. W119]|uniref:Lrp/AsnC family transcriptional regulator n=1 Tax=Amaricoccus sp. W119 TaxID=3391833 RepID=UPI0039A5F20B
MAREMDLDSFDIALLTALQRDGSLTNAALAGIVNLSASQCSRRRAALEQAGVIEGYAARLSATKLGYGFRAIMRVNLSGHGQGIEDEFARFVAKHPQIRSAFSVSGDADYVLDIRARDLDAFADFVHRHLLPHPRVAQVRSEIVLKTLKDERGIGPL